MDGLENKTLIDRYYLRKRVASGGMADVFLAWDQQRSAKVAIKILRRDLARDSQFNSLLEREAAVLQMLNHPFIVRLYEFERDGDVAFIVMDWVEGKNISQIMSDNRQPFPLSETLRIIDPICRALHYAHQQNVFHCDIKPSNIMLHEDGRVLLTDFGVAHLSDEFRDGGTPPFMAPEQFAGGSVDARTDIYALGVTLYVMLAGGNLPFQGNSPNSQGSTQRDRIAWEHLNLPIPPIQKFNPSLTEAVIGVISKAMCKPQGERYSTTLQFLESFERAVAVSPQVKRAENFQPSQRNVSAHTRLPVQDPRRSDPVPAQPRSPVQKQSTPLPRADVIAGPYLYCRKGQLVGYSIPISPQGLIIGRGTQCSLRISEPSVSRIHAAIIFGRKGTVYLRDELSSVGTFLNGARIQGTVVLSPGDVVQIGHTQIFEFRVS